MGHSRSLGITLALLALRLDGSYEQTVGGDGALGGLAWLFWALDFLELEAMVGCGTAGSVGNHTACKVLSAAAGVTASTVHTGSLPVAPKQSLALGEQSRLMTDAERLVQAGPGGGAGRGPGRQLCASHLQRRLGPAEAASQWPVPLQPPSPTPVATFIPIVQCRNP